MEEHIIRYSFSENNTRTMVFVPGYTGGLETPVLKLLIEHYVQKGGYNIFGILLPYNEDIQDIFTGSQEKLILQLDCIKSEAPNTEILLCAKSLGGSLSLYNDAKLSIDKLVLLGCSIVLGWPQRISLLSMENPVIPNYKEEWSDTFKNLETPLLIISGDKDDLCDNEYLSVQQRRNKNINLFIVEDANHNFFSINSGELKFDECVYAIDQFISPNNT